MDITLLKPLHSRAQIITLIEKASLHGGDIWQSNPQAPNGRQVIQIIQIINDLKSDRVILRTPSIIKISPDQPIFVRLKYRNIIFRVFPKDFWLNGDRINCRYPEQARALEVRPGGDRYVLPFSSDISLSLKRIEKTMKEMTYELELRIIDVSTKGFGILISSHNREYFQRCDRFWLKSIDHETLRVPILGTVCYVAPKGYYLKRGDVRVGLSLSIPLEREKLDYLKRKSVLVLSA
jgi:hypothetical protein